MARHNVADMMDDSDALIEEIGDDSDAYSLAADEELDELFADLDRPLGRHRCTFDIALTFGYMGCECGNAVHEDELNGDDTFYDDDEDEDLD